MEVATTMSETSASRLERLSSPIVAQRKNKQKKALDRTAKFLTDMLRFKT